MIRKRIFLLPITVLLVLLFGACQPQGEQPGSGDKKLTEFPEPQVQEPEIPKDTFDITDYGAVGNGKFDNTEAFAKTVEACAQSGGGVIYVPKGKFYTTPIHLKSNMNLHVSKNAEIIFSDKPADYLPPVFTRWEGIECYNYSPLIYAKDCHDLAITGKGKFNGNGEDWWHWQYNGQKQTLDRLYDMVMEGRPVKERILPTEDDTSFLRPSFVQFINCERILIKDYTISNGPMWTNHLVYCKHVTTRNLQVITEGANNDGIVTDASKNVLVEDCYFSTGDDCIVVKSGLNEDGWRVGKASRNIWVRRCSTRKGHGGVVVGSEMSGGVENLYVRDCQFRNTDRGIRVKSMKGRGGYVRNLHVRNVTMENIKYEAILLNMKYGSSSIAPRNDSVPVFSDIVIENVKCKGANYGIRMIGLEEQPIRNIHISDMTATARYGTVLRDSRNITIRNTTLNSTTDTAISLYSVDSIRMQNMEVPEGKKFTMHDLNTTTQFNYTSSSSE